MDVGTVWWGERVEWPDAVTAHRAIRMGHHARPHFASDYTGNDWLADGRRLVFLLRTGVPNFFLAGWERDGILQLTDHPPLHVRRRSFYVDCHNYLYYWRHPELVRLHLDTLREQVFWQQPERFHSSIPAVDTEGTLLFISSRERLSGDGGFEVPAKQHVYRIEVKESGCQFTSLAYPGNRFDRNWPYFIMKGYHEPRVRANAAGMAISSTCSREGISPDVYVARLEEQERDAANHFFF